MLDAAGALIVVAVLVAGLVVVMWFLLAIMEAVEELAEMLLKMWR